MSYCSSCKKDTPSETKLNILPHPKNPRLNKRYTLTKCTICGYVKHRMVD